MTDPDSRIDSPPLRWGILGPGGIAGAFVDAARRNTRTEVVAVGSRSQERARTFAERLGIGRAHASYQALVDDPLVQAVYVASPHSEHRDHCLMAISAGKHVLVEKAFTQNASQAAEVFDAARSARVLVMEAMWTRFLPHMVALRQVVSTGGIGEPVGLIADHGQNMAHHPPHHRLHDPALAGGALLDLGVYPVSFAHDLLGPPTEVRAVGSLTPTGVDGQVTVALRHGETAQSSLHTTLWASTPTTAAVFGTEGRIEIAGSFYRPTTYRVTLDDGRQWAHDGRGEGGFQYEIAEVARLVDAGAVESPLMPWRDTLAVMETLDEIRRQIGLAYPGE